ncbi:hypothetical protein BCR44DRAFT_1224637 [Catenaria anguillulae PL171]|uniref:Uncharacterized protein n=1 Tax=Catenaria anguillulae PL171 TaxID=765915 RepID=A0A1Y2HFL9_9FUNG|nr:hypothetical protein BCR44DRAFT_1224637 [Catenaria anguillulae PL171]
MSRQQMFCPLASGALRDLAVPIRRSTRPSGQGPAFHLSKHSLQRSSHLFHSQQVYIQIMMIPTRDQHAHMANSHASFLQVSRHTLASLLVRGLLHWHLCTGQIIPLHDHRIQQHRITPNGNHPDSVHIQHLESPQLQHGKCHVRHRGRHHPKNVHQVPSGAPKVHAADTGHRSGYLHGKHGKCHLGIESVAEQVHVVALVAGEVEVDRGVGTVHVLRGVDCTVNGLNALLGEGKAREAHQERDDGCQIDDAHVGRRHDKGRRVWVG